jgi:hypothetical protein
MHQHHNIRRALFLATIPASLLATSAYAVVPPPPTLTTAGQVIHDPNDAPSTLLMRVTDANTFPGGAINSYSYYPTFNSNSTKIILGGLNGGSYLYDFNPNTFTLGAKRNLFLSRAPDNSILDWQDAIWSSTDPNVIYAHPNIGTKLWAYNVSSNSYALVKDFSVVAGTPSATGNTNPYLWQMSKSKDDNTFGFSIRYNDNNSYAYTGYIAWNKPTNTFLVNNAKPAQGLDEVQVDKSGRYLVVKTEAQGLNALRAQIIDMQNHTTTNMLDGVSTVGHSDNGTGKLVTADNWQNSIVLRNLANPTVGTTLVSMGNDWTNANHISMLANDESKVLISYFGSTNGSWPGDSRLVWVNTDGSGTMTPLAYHYSVYHDYYDSPRADISADGRFIAFTSNWGDSGRLDTFILQIAMLGDANRDGVVNFADFTALSNNYGKSAAGWTGGDFNGDGTTNFADFTLLSNNYGHSTTGSNFTATPDELAALSAFGASAIPEPASLALLAVGGLALLTRRRRAAI